MLAPSNAGGLRGDNRLRLKRRSKSLEDYRSILTLQSEVKWKENPVCSTCVYVCVSVHACLCIQMSVCAHISVGMCMHVHMFAWCACMCACVCVHMIELCLVCMRVHMHTCVCMHVHTCMCVYVCAQSSDSISKQIAKLGMVTHAISAVERLRQEECHELKANLD